MTHGRTGLLTLVVALLLSPAPWGQAAPAGQAPDEGGALGGKLYSELRDAAGERYLGPDVYWRPEADYAWGWYAARPSFGGWHRMVSFHWVGAPKPSNRRLYARRVRFHTRELARVLQQQAEARALAAAVEVERARADETQCPALRGALEALELLPPSAFDFAGLGQDTRDAERLVIAMDGTNVALTIPSAGPHGRITYSHNTGPVNAWAERFEAATETCWRPEAAS